MSLKLKNVLELGQDEEGQSISNVFMRPKPNGRIPLILDLSDLNADTEYLHFKMESLQKAIELLQPDCFMGSLDLSDAYYSIPVTTEDRKYLGFKWGWGSSYSTRVCLMGCHRQPKLSRRF